MSIAIGTKIGPYEIVGWLGAGGMGEVYRARDPRLGREVAIKVIPEALASDSGRVNRFEQEARAAGQLNHPNILAVYDVGVHAGAPYIISELLEGESLRSRLQRGALPARKAIEYACQTAEGLAAAHDKGIVHRDLKPDNLFITNEGRIKILDFGIAKLTQPGGADARHTGLPTETEAGTVVGTAGYMSPEQIRGEPVDARSDIFSVGTTIYEMLTGRPAFTRGTGADTMAAILKEDPADPLPANVPPALARIVSRCLEKRRETRFQSARDLAFGLEVLSDTAATTALAPTHTIGVPNRLLRASPWLVTSALAFGLAITVAWSLTRPVSQEPLRVTRFPLTLPSGQLLDGSGGAHMVALSPDGAQMAYVASPFRLYLRSMSEIDVKAIPGTEAFEGVREPAFSPDGSEIAFFALADQTLKRMAVSGGAALTICQAETPTGISWGSDGIVFGQGRKGIMRISQKSLSGSAAGTPELIVRVKEGEVAHGPQLLPGGDQMLFTLATGTSPEYSDRWDKAHVVVQSLKSGVTKTLIEGGSDARYVTTGHIVYAVSGSLYAVAFDIARLEVIGSPVRIIEGVRRAAGTFTGAANFTFSSNGSLMYVPGPISASSAQMDIALMDRSGDVRPLKLKAGPYLMPRVSPDGKRIALQSDDGKEAVVWTYDLSGKTRIQRLTSGGNNRHPIWTSDGKRIVFQSDREGDAAIFWQSADGTGPAQRLTKAEPGESHSPESWSPSGDILMFSVSKGSDVSLSTLSVHEQKVTPFDTVHSSNPPGSTFSPDGRWVAYTRAERGRMTVWVQPFPPTGAKYELVAQGSDLPKHVRWSPDQKELFYNPRPNGFEAIGITTQPTFAFGNPVALPKKLRFSPQGTRTPYDVTPDGKFVGVIPWGETLFDQGSDDQILVVLNWFEELKARVPVR